MTQVLDPVYSYHNNIDDHRSVVVKTTTEIPQEFHDALKAEKAEKADRPMGDMHRFARIPFAVMLKWRKEGFDVMREPAAKIIAKLSAEGLDDFIVTPKKL
jgi:hypothetical protein